MHRLISYNYNTSVRRTLRPITMDYIIWCEKRVRNPSHPDYQLSWNTLRWSGV